jgi:hypothetical protein
MATILESLKGVNAYPIPLRTLVQTAELRGLTLGDEATQAVQRGKAYNLAKADLLLWLSLAPDITQGGQSFGFTDEQRKQLRNQANGLYDEFEEESSSMQPTYGYKGSRL